MRIIGKVLEGKNMKGRKNSLNGNLLDPQFWFYNKNNILIILPGNLSYDDSINWAINQDLI